METQMPESVPVLVFQKRCKYCGDDKGVALQWDGAEQFVQCVGCGSTRPVGKG